MGTKNAIVAGATGLIGTHLIEEMMQSNVWDNVFLYGRNKPRGTWLANQENLHTVIADLAKVHQMPASELELEGKQIDSAFCCLGTTMKKAGSKEAFRIVDFEYVMNFAQLARDYGAKHFLVVSSIGADEKNMSFYLRTKGQMERELDKFGFQYLHIFRPSILLGDRYDSRPLEALGGKITSSVGFLMAGPLKHYRPIEARTVALSMHQKSQELNLGTHIHLSGNIKPD